MLKKKAKKPARKRWWVYIIETQKGPLYTGITTDLERRFRQHSGELKGGAKYFRAGAPKQILFQKTFANRSLASKFEAHVKGLTRAQKLQLISGSLDPGHT